MKKDARDALAVLAARPDGVHTLATVVRVQGSSYRRVGARMLVHASGVIAGSVSGGCLEGEIARKGRWWAEHGPVVKRFAESGDADAVSAAGCGGVIDVLIENVRADDERGPLAALRWIAERRVPARIVTVIGGERLGERRLGARHVSTGDEVWPHSETADGETLVEDVDAPRELLVAGRHHDIAPVVRLARMMGWDVTSASRGVGRRALGEPDQVIEPTADAVAAWTAARPGAAIVLMTHDLELDRRLLAAILPVATPSYLGVLGPAHRTARIIDGLDGIDATPRALAVVRTPVGLDLGGDGPEAVALSIISDVQATWHARAGGRLCAPGTGAWSTPRLVATAS
ncbi:MAG TPA: XdhC family protein [Kofleriaceae bacterium]|nr:XdhC family protein [Kofleriaceae bacterium]